MYKQRKRNLLIAISSLSQSRKKQTCLNRRCTPAMRRFSSTHDATRSRQILLDKHCDLMYLQFFENVKRACHSSYDKICSVLASRRWAKIVCSVGSIASTSLCCAVCVCVCVLCGVVRCCVPLRTVWNVRKPAISGTTSVTRVCLHSLPLSRSRGFIASNWIPQVIG